MRDPRHEAPSEDASSKTVASVGWGLLLVWIGAALLLKLSWGIGLIGAGAIVLAMHAIRSHMGLPRDRFGFTAGLLLVLCGVWSLFGVRVDLLPLLCIAAGIALLVSTWRARRAPPAPGERPDLHAASHPRA